MSSSTSVAGPPAGLFGRLGGTLLHPRRTLSGVLERPGRTSDLVMLFAVLVGLAARPEAATRALLLIPESLVGGLGALVRVLVDTVLIPVVALSVYGWILERKVRGRPHAPSGEGVQAAVALTLVPFLALMLLGALLERLGVWSAVPWLTEVLPPRSIRGALFADRPLLATFRLLVGWGPTLLLLAWLTRSLARRTGP